MSREAQPVERELLDKGQQAKLNSSAKTAGEL
jgi:hypothetical protein